MFPSLRVSVSGLEAEARYFLILESRLSEGKRYKFSGGSWSGVGPADPQPHPSTRVYVHPDSPSPGSAWMAQDVLFQKAKLTNNTLDRSGNVSSPSLMDVATFSLSPWMTAKVGYVTFPRVMSGMKRSLR